MAVGIDSTVVHEFLALRRSVVAVHRVQLFPIDKAAAREPGQRRGVVAAVARADVHRPRPVAVHGEGVEDVELAI